MDENIREAQAEFCNLCFDVAEGVNKTYGEINGALEQLGVEDEELYNRPFTDYEYDIIEALGEKLTDEELDVLIMVINGNYTLGMEATMSDHQRKIMITKIIDDRLNMWNDSFGVDSFEEE